PVEPSPAFDALMAKADAAKYPAPYRYMGYRVDAAGRSLPEPVHYDRRPETEALKARYTEWLSGRAALRTKHPERQKADRMSALLDQPKDHRTTAEASVILRRQVPIRFDEPPRSWLGGLPRMPGNIRWPRTGIKGRPLPFIAQIACADLPKQIWN